MLLLTKDGSRLTGEPIPTGSIADELFGEYQHIKVKELELRFPQRFTDKELAQVLDLREIEWIAISESRITDRGLLQLSRIKGLQRLDIEGCNVSRQAVMKLQRSLPNTKIWSDYED